MVTINNNMMLTNVPCIVDTRIIVMHKICIQLITVQCRAVHIGSLTFKDGNIKNIQHASTINTK
jgi:hypothetical protein